MQKYATWASSSLIFLKNRDKCTVMLFPCKIVLWNRGERKQNLAEPNMHILNMQYMQLHTWNAQYAKEYQICNKFNNIPWQTYAKYAINIPNMQHMQKHPTFAIYSKIHQICKICNKIPKYAINRHNMQNHTVGHGATGSDTTSVAERQASPFQECPLTTGSLSSG